jgi:hypothetical protein
VKCYIFAKSLNNSPIRPGEASYTQAIITSWKKKGPILAEEHCISNIEHLVEME